MRFLRKLFIGILAVIVLALSSIAYLYYRFDPNEVIRIISTITEKKYGLSIQTGQLRMDLRTGLDFQDLKILDISKNTVLIDAKQGSLFYNPLSLLKKNVDILSVKLSGVDETLPEIRTVINKFRSGNRPSTNQMFHFELHSLTIEKSFLRINPDLTLGIQGTADFNNGFRNPSIRAEMVAADGRGLPFSGKIRLEGKIDRFDIRVTDLDLGKLAHKTNFLSFHQVDGTISRKDGNWYLQGKNLDGKWNLYSLKADDFTADLSVTPLLLHVQSPKLFFNQSPAVLKELTYDFQEKKLDIDIPAIQAEISNLMPGFDNPGQLNGNIRITYQDGLLLDGNISISNASFRQVMLPEGRFNIENNTVSGSLQADLPGCSLEAILSKQSILNASPLKIRLSSKKLGLSVLVSEFAKARSSQDSAENKTPGRPLIFPIEFSGEIQEVTLSNWTAFHLSFNGAADKTEVSLAGFSLEFLGGDLSGRANYRDGLLEGDISYSEGKLRELTDILFHDDKIIYGTVDLQAKFHLNPGNIQTLSADFTAEAKNGEIKNLFMQNSLRKLLYDIPLDSIFFDSVSVTGKWNGMILDLKDLTFDSHDIRIRSSGDLDFQKKLFRGEAFISFDKEYLLPLPNLTQILTSGFEDNGRIRFQVDLDGSFSKPSFALKK